MDRKAAAETFHALHQGPGVLVLPNCWDAASARLLAEAGATAVATSSAAFAWSLGYADGHYLPTEELLASLRRVARVIDVPLTADIEGGYSADPKTVGETVAQVIEAGAVGVNLEDGREPHDLHCAKIAAAREAAERSGVPLFINARIDVYLKRLAEGEAALEETLRRAEGCRAAGASGIFVPGPADAELIRTLAAGIDLPLNVMGRAGVPAAGELAELGARRLSSATGLFRAAFATLDRATKAFLQSGDPGALAEAGNGCPEFNGWFAPH